MKKRILYIFKATPELISKQIGSGGFISNFLLFGYEKKYFDIHILAINSSIENSDVIIDGIHFYTRKIPFIQKPKFLNEVLGRILAERFIKEVIGTANPNVIMADTSFIKNAVACAKQSGLKSVIWLRAYENFHTEDDDLNYRVHFYSKLGFFIRRLLFRTGDIWAIKNADLVLTNSNYMRDRIITHFGVKAKIVYPPIDSDLIRLPAPKEKIVGFLKPEIKKGLTLVINIAKRMPDVRFICFGEKPINYKIIEEEVDNLVFAGWVQNNQKIFSSIRILLIPSLWEEPFGRGAIEAAAFGVLPIVSEKGGLLEAVGYCEEIIIKKNEDYANVWVSKIKTFLIDQDAYDLAIEKVRKHITQYLLTAQGEILKKLIEKALKY